MLLLIYSLFSSVSRHGYGFLDSYNCPCRTFATGNAWWAKGPFRKAGSSIEQVVWAWVKIVDRQNRWFKFDTKSDQPFVFHCYPHYLSVAGPNCRSSWSKKAAHFWSLLLEDNLKKVDMWRSRISDYRIGRRGIFSQKNAASVAFTRDRYFIQITRPPPINNPWHHGNMKDLSAKMAHKMWPSAMGRSAAPLSSTPCQQHQWHQNMESSSARCASCFQPPKINGEFLDDVLYWQRRVALCSTWCNIPC